MSLQKFIGGNNVITAPDCPIKAFVVKNGGHTIISRILIANNGIGAVKEIRSIRQWAYSTFKNERIIKFIVMASAEDIAADAEHIRLADQYVEVPGGSNNNNYANVDLIVDIAERTDAHAVWAGWGHASENPKLPEKLMASKKKIVFIGPPPSAMYSLGDKISSSIVAQTAKVPTMPWSGDGIAETFINKDGCVEVAPEIYLKATTTDVQIGLQQAERIGFPVMIKASEGGGGKGIRMSKSKEDFVDMFNMCQNEVPGSPIFIMKLATDARHLEVQVLADHHGNAISLLGRDCTVQRRHQKIFEEAPVTIAPRSTFSLMEKAAVRLAKLVGYASAGTVEYLYIPKEDKFYFLELNPRLQVEHPTTEMVTGVNLPAAQLLVAMGIPLNNNIDIRRFFGFEGDSSSNINFDDYYKESTDSIKSPEPRGHVIAARITSENPEAGFKPSSGSVKLLNFKSNSKVWGYFSVSPSSSLHEFADSQFGHIFAYSSNREEARQAMIMALKEISIQGDFFTTTSYLVTLLKTEDFVENRITTSWLDKLIESHLIADRPPPILAAICGASCTAFKNIEEITMAQKQTYEKGQFLSASDLGMTQQIDFIYEGYDYNFLVYRTGPSSFTLEINESTVDVELKRFSDGGILVEVDESSHICYLKQEVGAIRMQIDEFVVLLEEKVDPTLLRSASPGKLVRYLVENGTHIQEGQAYAEIEVMKMYMSLVSSEEGIVHFVKPAGSVISAGELLGTLELTDPSKVKVSPVFEGKLPACGPPKATGNKPHQRLARLVSILTNIIDGYHESQPSLEIIKELDYILSSNLEVPFLRAEEIASSLRGRIPESLEAGIISALDYGKRDRMTFPSKPIGTLISKFLSTMDPLEVPKYTTLLDPLSNLVEMYSEGLDTYKLHIYSFLINRFCDTEFSFCSKGDREPSLTIQGTPENDDFDKYIQRVISHSSIKSCCKLILNLLEVTRDTTWSSEALHSKYETTLRSLTTLSSRECAKVALKAREVLIETQIPSFKERERQMEQILVSSVSDYVYAKGIQYHAPSYAHLQSLVGSNYYVFDILHSFFYHPIKWVRLAAIETYVRRAYHLYSLADINYILEEGQPLILAWSFYLPADVFSVWSPTLNNKAPLQRVMSVSDLSFVTENLSLETTEKVRHGVMSTFDSYEEFVNGFDTILANMILSSGYNSRSNSGSSSPTFQDRHIVQANSSNRNKLNLAPLTTLGSNKSGSSEPKKHIKRYKDVINITIRESEGESIDNNAWAAKLESFTKSRSADLRIHGVRRITYQISRKNSSPMIFTFRESMDYSENTTIRNIEPALAYQLELSRLSNYNIEPYMTGNQQFHIYRGSAKNDPNDTRIFIRVLVRHGTTRTAVQTVDYLISETDRLVTDILDSLEILMDQYPSTDCNHLFINFLPIFNLDASHFEPAYRGFLDRHGERLFKLRVSIAEIRFLVQSEPQNDSPMSIRFFVFNELGFVPKLESYVEVIDSESNDWVLRSLDSPPGSLDKVSVSHAVPVRDTLQALRYKAHKLGTTYVYDYPSLFKHASVIQWRKIAKKNKSAVQPIHSFEQSELVWDTKENKLIESSRPPGMSKIGMVGWVLKMFTPECPTGRKIVLIANDITSNIGSFGVDEDVYFYEVTKYARIHGLPRVYISANSGARIGLAEEVKSLFQTCFVDPEFPEQGFQYLYLTPEGKQKLDELSKSGPQSVLTEKIVTENGETRYKLTAIIGIGESLGVENLMGSGLIAGETSRAYRDIFTITLVTCRSVGIGAYLVRLGERVIQNEGDPIILTGNQALNKVLGREVYTSNAQLGGTQIMYRNGVSHLTSRNDFVGINKILRWLSFVPPYKGAPIIPAKLLTWDPVEREIEYCPPKGPSDPRNFLEGVNVDGVRQSGFFDEGSFIEVLGGWAKTVVTGRARLGGLPVGVIAVETRVVENVTPADPANVTSREQVNMEAGGVWYPNSAYKTSQAIQDFNNGEGLPLFIFANWRGFSGGQRDMYDQVLKFGSYIVDALTEYQQPVFVYIIPNGELRGGAWVVLDSSINPEVMEMYADSASRGGIIEPQGIVQIKYRKPAIVSTMLRLDTKLAELKRQLDLEELSEKDRELITFKFDQRVRLLYPVYNQVAVEFADLHDRAGRMLAKKVIRKILEWKSARTFFYHRLLRRLKEDMLCKRLKESHPDLKRAELVHIIQKWFITDTTGNSDDATIKQIIATDLFNSSWETNDKEIYGWLEQNFETLTKRSLHLAERHKLTEIQELASQNTDFAKEAASLLLSLLDEDSRKSIIKSLNEQQ
ncbi:hypothetical protein BB560_002423 [Smittium megazygosporum]|uniref:Uncharacterized protein n=1 Tax=Smittium megazygosporum TaxID=133381 RepID=A0A2T9ZEV9_9FUNG|nr:hypothetical protein BB560_002423 [Smittium megazygosporum]